MDSLYKSKKKRGAIRDWSAHGLLASLYTLVTREIGGWHLPKRKRKTKSRENKRAEMRNVFVNSVSNSYGYPPIG